MIAFLILALSISFISGHPAGADQDPACKTLQRFEKSLISAVTQKEEGPYCMDSQAKSKRVVKPTVPVLCKSFSFSAEYTSASLEIVKQCLKGVEVDKDCLSKAYKVRC